MREPARRSWFIPVLISLVIQVIVYAVGGKILLEDRYYSRPRVEVRGPEARMLGTGLFGIGLFTAFWTVVWLLGQGRGPRKVFIAGSLLWALAVAALLFPPWNRHPASIVLWTMLIGCSLACVASRRVRPQATMGLGCLVLVGAAILASALGGKQAFQGVVAFAIIGSIVIAHVDALLPRLPPRRRSS